MVFSSNGEHIIYATRPSRELSTPRENRSCKIRAIALSELMQNRNKNVSQLIHLFEEITVDNVIALQSIDDMIIVTNKLASLTSSADNIEYRVHVYQYQNTQNMSFTPVLVQTVTVQLPVFSSRLSTKSSSLKNPDFECSLSLETSKGRFLLLASR